MGRSEGQHKTMSSLLIVFHYIVDDLPVPEIAIHDFGI